MLRPYPWLAAAIATLGVAVTISSGTWIVGVPELVRRGLDDGAGQGAALVLTMSAAQAEIPDSHLGRVTGLISLVHRGAHATGLLLVSPLFAVVATRSVFVGAAFAIPLVGLVAAAIATRGERAGAGGDARAPANRR